MGRRALRRNPRARHECAGRLRRPCVPRHAHVSQYRDNIAKRGGPVLGPGHHCVIEGPDKKLWLVYHQKWNDATNFKRFLALDPLWFDGQGVLHAKVSRETNEPAP